MLRERILLYPKARLRRVLPTGLLNRLRGLRDKKDFLLFLTDHNLRISFSERLALIKQVALISRNVRCMHTEGQVLAYMRAILSLPERIKGSVVEVGTYRGGSTAKFSLAAKIAKRELVVFDSFQGIPDNSEDHDKDIFGGEVKFKRGYFYASFEGVLHNITKFGNVEVCRFIKGYVEETLPHFKDEVAAIYLDVDLASSTKTCLKYLYPLLQPGGVLYSQDGHLPLVVAVFDDDSFWENKVGFKKPYIDGLGRKTLIKIVKSWSQIKRIG